jgi:glycine hydroxymethyltransferase
LVTAGFSIVSGGTDTHLLLLDLSNKNITGKAAEEALDLAGITVNKNTVPFETRSPFITSGIRIGTPALTTRGMKNKEMNKVAEMIINTIDHIQESEYHKKTRANIKNLCDQFPLYAEFTNKCNDQ